MNNIYLYDGSFKSLLSLIFALDSVPDDIKSINNYEENLLDNYIYLKITNDFVCSISHKIIKILYYAFLADKEGKELSIYQFVKKYEVYGDQVVYHREFSCVNEVLRLSKKVSNEAHKIKGFLRFKKMSSNFYFASINPTHDVIYIVAKHFVRRFKSENFVIYDENRGIYAFYNKNKLIFLKKEDIIKLNLELDSQETEIENLWKTFFNKISIKERENRKVQRGFMPKKYWKNIIEMDDNV